jgi:light-regulated signal transduction histidine kinase (bacteriophytochrome)
MNERIAELQTQCIVREVRGTTAFDSYMVDRFDTEKFAELIVQECADLVDTLNEAYDAPSTAGKFIKQHFGVE